MEYFDIVDSTGNPTGETVERSIAHRDGIKHRTAHVWVVRKKENGYDFLLQKRAMIKDSFPGRYDTSSAGHIKAGDEPLMSAVRELGEELGIQASIAELEFADKFDIHYSKEFHGKMFCDDEVSFVYIYTGKVDDTELKLQEEEVEAVEWFDMYYLDRALSEPRDMKFCVPRDGFLIAKKWCEEHK